MNYRYCLCFLLLATFKTQFTECSLCGRTSCYSDASGLFATSDPVPFLPNQRCSCSSRCALFDDCCEDFRVISKNFVHLSLSHLLIENNQGQKPLETIGLQCGLPRLLASPSKQVHFADKVPPFYHIANCPEDAPEMEGLNENDPLAGNIFVTDWPVVDVTTGIVFDNIFTARCNSRLKNQPPLRDQPIAKGPLKYWPSFEILCDNETVTQLAAKFNPFNPDHAHQILNVWGCNVELTDPQNPVMFPISYCIPFSSAAKVVMSGCIISSRHEAAVYDEGCLKRPVEVLAIYPSYKEASPPPVPMFYRNSDCAKCSGFDEESEHNCSFSVEQGWRFQPAPRARGVLGTAQFRKMTNYNSFRMLMDFSWSPEDLAFPGISDDFEQSRLRQTCESDDDVFVPFLGTCHQLKINADEDEESIDSGMTSTPKVEGSRHNSKNKTNCFLEIQKQNPLVTLYDNGTLVVKSVRFSPQDYKLNENGTIILRYCFDALQSTGDDTHLHGEREIPIRDIISRFATLAFMVLSIFSLIFLLVIYGLFPQLRNVPGKVIMCLSATLLAALAGYSIGVLALEKIWYPICFSLGVFVHYCFLCSFAFSSCLAYDIWRTFRNKSSSSTQSEAKRLFLRYSIFGWGAPFCVCLLAILIEFSPNVSRVTLPRPRYSMPVSILHPADFHTSDYHEHSVWVCWMMNRMAVIAYFKVPVGICLLANFVFFAWTIVSIRQASEHSVRAGRGHSMGLRRRLFIYFKLSTIMGMTWLFGFIAAATKIEALWIPFGLANSLQGFYVCMSFVFTKKVARLLRGWAAGDRRESIDPRAYASTNNSSSTSTMPRTTSMPKGNKR